MDLFMLFVIVGAAFAVRAAWKHGTETRAGSRVMALKAAAGKSPVPLSRTRKQMIARQHDAGWWLSEALHGFPVLRTGLHAGWLAHEAAAIQGRHKVEEARTTQAEIRAVFATRLAEYRKRQAEAYAQIRDGLTDPAGGREAAEQAAGKVLPFARPNPADPEPPPAPSPPPQPEPGPCAPEDDLSAEPAGSTTDPQSGFRQPPQPPERNRVPAMTTATAADATYDGTQRELTQMAVKLEAAIAEIRFEQVQNQLEMVAATVSDSQTLGDLSDTADELQRAKAALQRAEETVLSAKSRLRHNHGNLNEAHQGNPVAPADKEFYQEG